MSQRRAILQHPNPAIGLVSVRVIEGHPDGKVSGVFADFQSIAGYPLTAKDIREIEAEA